jgi:hypothetical protein
MKRHLISLAFVFSCGLLMGQACVRPDLSVYPNPAAEYIMVEDQNELVFELAVISLTGRKVRQFIYERGGQYSIVDLPKGVYLVQIIDRNKRVLSTQKLDKR